MLIKLNPNALELIFNMSVPAKQNGAFWYIVLRVMLLTYTRAMIRFSNCGGLSRMRQPYPKYEPLISRDVDIISHIDIFWVILTLTLESRPYHQSQTTVLNLNTIHKNSRRNISDRLQYFAQFVEISCALISYISRNRPRLWNWPSLWGKLVCES